MTRRFSLLTQLLTFCGLSIGLLVSHPASGQDVDLRRLVPPGEQTAAKTDAGDGMTAIHVTDRLVRSPEGREAFSKYVAARDAGRLPLKKRTTSYEVGDEKVFNVLDNLHADQPSWKALTFILRSTNDVANVWIDKTLDDTFSDENLAELDEHMLRTTPESSFRPDKGIIENDNYLFGDPPNYDQDGKVDILLHDIKEGGDSGSCCVLGYVTSQDLNPAAGAGVGNQADVLYVDLPDGIRGGVSGIAWIVAHEYQHLIHFAYQTSSPELAFVNEGLSEWASIVNGYFHRRIDYLSDPAEHGTPLLEWNTEENVYDYERAGLFTGYIAQHLGPEATGSIVQARLPADLGGAYAIGEKGYEVVLDEAGIDLSSVIAGFHVANFVNDTGLDPYYGYALPQRSGITTGPTTPIDGTSASSFNRIDFAMNSGAVHYFTWTDVANLSIQADIFSQVADVLKEGQRERIQLRAYMEYADGRRAIETIAPGLEFQAFPGDFARFTLIVVNTSPFNSSPKRLDLNSSWDPAGSSGVVRQTISYDNGLAAPSNLDDARYLSVGASAYQATRFIVPENGRLESVFVAPIYENQFVGENGEPILPAGLPRDFRLHIWDDNGAGQPGLELFSADVSDNPDGTHVNFRDHSYIFLEYKLPSNEPALSGLPDTVYIGISNTGSDQNHLILTVSEYKGEDVSYLSLPSFDGDWASLSDIFVPDGSDTTWVFEDHVFPIRAEFVVSTSIDEDDFAELPEQVSLDQNYPNPFNPATSISFAIPEASHVRLAVYDALGREVATLVDGVRNAGSHSVQLDAAGWASGVYFYTLTTEAQTRSRSMILMK